jgi:hypothetical protein
MLCHFCASKRIGFEIRLVGFFDKLGILERCGERTP